MEGRGGDALSHLNRRNTGAAMKLVVRCRAWQTF